jgi:hypothetical protein
MEAEDDTINRTKVSADLLRKYFAYMMTFPEKAFSTQIINR